MSVRILALCCVLVAGTMSASELPGPRTVLVVPMGEVPIATVDQLCRTYRARLQLQINRTAVVPIDESLVDLGRGQMVAERALQWLERRYPREASEGVVIGVTAMDQYIADRTWRFAFSLRHRRPNGSRLAVISIARMREEFYDFPPDEALLASRLGKMFVKNIGVLYFGMPLNDNPKSVLYRNVLSLEDLDAMGDQLPVRETR